MSDKSFGNFSKWSPMIFGDKEIGPEDGGGLIRSTEVAYQKQNAGGLPE